MNVFTIALYLCSRLYGSRSDEWPCQTDVHNRHKMPQCIDSGSFYILLVFHCWLLTTVFSRQRTIFTPHIVTLARISLHQFPSHGFNRCACVEPETTLHWAFCLTKGTTPHYFRHGGVSRLGIVLCNFLRLAAVRSDCQVPALTGIKDVVWVYHVPLHWTADCPVAEAQSNSLRWMIASGVKKYVKKPDNSDWA